ncbi:MAG: hypothetical protein PVI57_01235 [Gemmatimonadota bacterium]|jgi:hypothetical protein
MASEPTRTRSWTDREGNEWEVAYNPGVELDTRRDRAFRERIVFRRPEVEHHAPAAFGSDLEAMGDGDLQGLLDQARERREDDASPWETDPVGR